MDYIPTTEEARNGYSFGQCESWCERCGESDLMPDEFHGQEFDRWLAERDRKVKAKAWDEGYESGFDKGFALGDGLPDNEPTPANPYRQGEEQ